MKKHWKGLLVLSAAAFACCAPMAASADWQQTSNGNWYYYTTGGQLLTSRWIGEYYVDESGKRVTNSWIDGYFVGEDGKYIENFKGGWYKIGGKWYYYKKSGQKKTGWLKLKGKKYFLDSTGRRQTGWVKIKGATYYFSKKNGAMKTGVCKIGGKYYGFDETTGKQVLGWYTTKKGNIYYFNLETGYRTTGWAEIDGETYSFTSKGVARKGWKTLNGSRYYFSKKTGAMLTGFQKIGGKYYYFDEDGKMQTSTTVHANGKTYSVDSSGVCTQTKNSVSDEMLFFTLYESGSSASSLIGYAQTGGDSGSACGKYQFDYRYSLLPFVKYCYNSDKTAFKEFKKYAKYTDSQKYLLKSNTKFYKAWKKIYKRDPELFKSYQDAYAKQEYYDVTANYLYSYFGIVLSGRPDVVKGAVFSYSIQHGSITAAIAVANAGITNSTSNEEFLNLLYEYRMSRFPAYSSRYRSELNAALNLL